VSGFPHSALIEKGQVTEEVKGFDPKAVQKLLD